MSVRVGISVLTAWLLASRADVEISVGGPDARGLYAGWLTLGVEDRYRPLLSSEGHASATAARACMEELLAAVRASPRGQPPARATKN